MEAPVRDGAPRRASQPVRYVRRREVQSNRAAVLLGRQGRGHRARGARLCPSSSRRATPPTTTVRRTTGTSSSSAAPARRDRPSTSSDKRAAGPNSDSRPCTSSARSQAGAATGSGARAAAEVDCVSQLPVGDSGSRRPRRHTGLHPGAPAVQGRSGGRQMVLLRRR